MVLAPGVQVLLGLLLVSALMTLLWFVQRRTGNAGIVDAGWAAGIGILGILFAATSDGYLPRRGLAALLIGIWSARLATYILLDRVLGRPEEGRYRTLRAGWGGGGRQKTFLFLPDPSPSRLVFRPAYPGHRLPFGGSLDGMGRRGRSDLVR